MVERAVEGGRFATGGWKAWMKDWGDKNWDLRKARRYVGFDIFREEGWDACLFVDKGHF